MFFGSVYIQKKVFCGILAYVGHLNTPTVNKASKVGRTDYYTTSFENGPHFPVVLS